MTSCAYCRSSILFGGKRAGDLRFCSEACLQNGSALVTSHQIPDDVVMQQALQISAGPCPECHQHRGPIDVHVAHQVWSALVVTSWSSTAHVSCRSCGVKSQASALASSLLVGWWGFPWGLIMTPVQIGKNIHGLLGSHEGTQPSVKLQQIVRAGLAKRAMEQIARDSNSSISS